MAVKKSIHFEISERKMLLRILDSGIAIGVVFLMHYFFNNAYFTLAIANWTQLILLVFYVSFFGTIFELYNLQVSSNQFYTIKSVLLTSTATVFAYLFTPILSPSFPEQRLPILLFYLFLVFALLFWRQIYVHFLASTRFSQKVVLICEESQVNSLVDALEAVDPHYKIIAFVAVNSSVESQNLQFKTASISKADLSAFVHKNGVTEIVISDQNAAAISTELYQQLLFLLETGKIIREYTQVFESKTQRIPVQFVGRDFYRFFPFSRSNSNTLYLVIVRFVEILVAILGIFVTILLVPIIFLINIFANQGSLFYTQERVGKDGAIFKILKFRTMRQIAVEEPSFANHNIARVTPFGLFMRKTRLDEFPQFFNIIKGDMAVIGPRPEQPFFVKEIAKIMPFYETRHLIKPGLTGWAQVKYAYGESIDDSLIKLQYDLYYIKHRSIYLDLDILLKTITTVVFYRGQ